jgi:hypothetical protein
VSSHQRGNGRRGLAAPGKQAPDRRGTGNAKPWRSGAKRNNWRAAQSPHKQ